MTSIFPHILAMESPMRHVMDEPWRLAGRDFPMMSSQVGVMILAAGILLVSMPLLARRARQGHLHSMGLIEMIVLFVREKIAYPAVGPSLVKAASPLLTSLFMFLLLCNLLGLVPLMEISNAIGLGGYGGTGPDGLPRYVTPIGGTPTSNVWVAAPFAALTLAMVFILPYLRNVKKLWRGVHEMDHPAEHHEHEAVPAGSNLWLALARRLEMRTWPLPVAIVGGMYTWLNGLVPAMSGLTGLIMWPMLLLIEVAGYCAKCFALCIRLVANMESGHVLLAVLLIFAEATRGWMVPALGLPIGVGMVLLMLMELMVAIMQAYIFTFLAALFVGLALSPGH